jgi:hypothetical protein
MNLTAMNVIRSLMSLLMLALIVISVLGVLWWEAPPDQLAHYTTGGKLTLGVLAVVGVLGIWRLWAPPKSTDAAQH